MSPTWWHRNRWALLALPFVLALVAVAGASRLVNFWWPGQLREPVPAAVGQPLRYTVNPADGGEASDATLVVGPTTEAQFVTDADGMAQRVPYVEGTRVWATDLTITAPVEDDLSLCYARVVDSRGRTSSYNSSTLEAQGVPFTPCSPPRSTDELFDDAWVRDETYTVPVLFRLAADAEPVELRLYWDEPEYVSVPLEVATD